MNNELGNIVLRKIMTTFVVTTIFLEVLGFLDTIGNSETVYNQGERFIGWFVFLFIYVGAVILLYGNVVSIGIEYMQRKWFPKKDWLYVCILGIFGLASGFFFQEMLLAWFGMFAAILYGIIDKWIYKRMENNKSIKMFLLIPIATLFLMWGYFQFTSPPMPPFTKEDAVTFSTSGEGTLIDHFPKEIGKNEEMIGGFTVKRETSVKKIEKEKYIVTFKEDWGRKETPNSWSISYLVDRSSSTLYDEQGKVPPYYKNNLKNR
ncbi:hypothetical protein [Sporosarcina sp. FSL K6-2383]|uniref:hypothetical protein n=1 Tax=Sporosarcina sp. FSL K6-2383 TaxID=2921556 RepID=UPI003159D451